jgi:hypothetical protein
VSVASTAAGRRTDKQIKTRRAAAVSRCMDQLEPAQAAALIKALPALEELADTMRRLA